MSIDVVIFIGVSLVKYISKRTRGTPRKDPLKTRETETERQRQRETETDRQIDRERDRQRQRQTDR